MIRRQGLKSDINNSDWQYYFEEVEDLFTPVRHVMRWLIKQIITIRIYALCDFRIWNGQNQTTILLQQRKSMFKEAFRIGKML